MDYQKRHCLDCYWYLPTYSSLTSLLKRNLFSIIPWSAVTKQCCVVGAGAVKVLLVCYSALILCMGCQVNSESVITLKKNWLYLVLKYVLILAFIFRNNAAVKPTTLQETLKACSSSLYPDVHTILRLLLIAPVTSATVERSHSSLCFVKNVYRSTMGQ